MTPKHKLRLGLLIAGVACITIVGVVVAQSGRFGQRGRRSSFDRGNFPAWSNDPQFKHDVFTFARVQYSSYYERWGRGRWAIDFPDSDLNFSYRLQELTSLKVDPDGVTIRLTDPKLFDYPFIYIVEPGQMILMPDEVAALRRYLLNGGFLMVDDFWGEAEYANFYNEIKKVFPDREPQELPLEHEIFHCVYDLKKKPQVPGIGAYFNGQEYDRYDGRFVHYRAIFDDNGRMVVLACHNTDLGDGWEREGVDTGYFEKYSEKWAYPMGINIVVYAMTH